MEMTTESHNSNHFYVNVNFPKTAKGENFPPYLRESLRDTDSVLFLGLRVLWKKYITNISFFLGLCFDL